jgi:hypothetical protein
MTTPVRAARSRISRTNWFAPTPRPRRGWQVTGPGGWVVTGVLLVLIILSGAVWSGPPVTALSVLLGAYATVVVMTGGSTRVGRRIG